MRRKKRSFFNNLSTMKVPILLLIFRKRADCRDPPDADTALFKGEVSTEAHRASPINPNKTIQLAPVFYQALKSLEYSQIFVILAKVCVRQRSTVIIMTVNPAAAPQLLTDLELRPHFHFHQTIALLNDRYCNLW